MRKSKRKAKRARETSNMLCSIPEWVWNIDFVCRGLANKLRGDRFRGVELRINGDMATVVSTDMKIAIAITWKTGQPAGPEPIRPCPIHIDTWRMMNRRMTAIVLKDGSFFAVSSSGETLEIETKDVVYPDVLGLIDSVRPRCAQIGYRPLSGFGCDLRRLDRFIKAVLDASEGNGTIYGPVSHRDSDVLYVSHQVVSRTDNRDVQYLPAVIEGVILRLHIPESSMVSLKATT